MASRKRPEIIFSDDHLAIVNKPAGVLSVPGRNAGPYPVLSDLLPFEQKLIVHRLDRDTSGLLIIALSKEAQKRLSRLFEEHRVTKRYLAIVNGNPMPASGLIQAPIKETPSGKMRINPGKNAETHYQTIEVFQGYSLLEATPKTGRRHQIRIHLSHIGHPLAVDVAYGSADSLGIADIKSPKAIHGKKELTNLLLRRTPLHASELGFVHPFTGNEVTFSSDLPKDMRACLNQLRRWKQATL